MPVLTDRQEPEDYNRPPPEDPNEYAIRYLYGTNRQLSVELERTGKVLFYSSAAASLMALLLYAGWLEFNFTPWLLAMGCLIVAISGLAAAWLPNRRRLALGVAIGPLLLTFATLLILGLGAQGEQAAIFAFFLPPSLAMAASVVVLVFAQRQR
jgi:hypothetical protein